MEPILILCGLAWLYSFIHYCKDSDKVHVRNYIMVILGFILVCATLVLTIWKDILYPFFFFMALLDENVVIGYLFTWSGYNL